MIYILVGEDPSRMEYKLETIRQKEKCDQSDRFDCRKAAKEEVENALETLSLFAEKTMVILENAAFLGAKNDTGLDLERIAGKALAGKDDKVIVFELPARKMDTRKKKVKELKEQATVIDCMPLDEKSQPAEIRQMMKERNMQMEPKAFEWFCENAGFSSPSLASQLDKLALYSSTLKLEDVRALTTVEPTHNVFKMTDALFARNRLKLLELYRIFRGQNMEPQAILGLLAGQIRFVYQVRVLMDQNLSKEQIMDRLNASSGRIWNTMRNASRFSAGQLLENLALLSHLDQAIKSGQMDKDTAFENFILQIGQPPASAR